MIQWFQKKFMHRCFLCTAHTFRKHGVIRYTSAETKDGDYHEVPLCKECAEALEQNRASDQKRFDGV